jgi:pimeloyl-ACP methyl ester carboxylesterase
MTTTTASVVSADGTRITYDRVGSGPPLVLVPGALGLRRSPFVQPWVKALAEGFTVFNYDRRGRGDSGDTAPYAVPREIEDLAALSREAGGAPFVWGISSGAALALEAAAAGVPMAKLSVYEPPYMVGDVAGRPDADYEERVRALIAEGRRDDALKYFMRTVGVPGFFVALMRLFPFWKQMRTVAHTLPYDAAVMGGFRLPSERFARIRIPTVVMTGASSPLSLRTGAEATARAIPGAQLRVLAKQNHGVKAAALAPALRAAFLTSAAQGVAA